MTPEKSKIQVYDRETEDERNYWLAKLAGVRSNSNLIPDYERPRTYVHNPDSLEVVLPDDVFRKLIELTKDSSFLVYVALLTALNIYLHRYTGETTIIIGSPPRQRTGDGPMQPNALAIVSEVEPQGPVKALLMQVRESLLAAYARQNYPYERLLRHMGLTQVENRGALFDVSLALRDIHGSLAHVRNDITITFARAENGLAGTIEFNRSLFAPTAIEQFANGLMLVLRQSLEHPNALIANIDLLGEEERRQLLTTWSVSGEAHAPDTCVQELFEAQVERTPEAIALVFEDETLTYRELNERANELAHYLRRLGVGPEIIVGLCVERSPLLLIGLLGILKAGGAYVPLDPAWPETRLAFILNDASVGLLLTQASLSEKVSACGAKSIPLDAEWQTIAQESELNPVTNVRPENLVYLCYTSGSTGEPKGVMIFHRALVSRVKSMVQNYRFAVGQRVLQFVSFSFDAAGEGIYPTLTSGATLVLHRNPAALPPGQLLEQCEQLQVTTLHIPPSYWQQIIDEWVAAEKLVPAWIKLFITGGESIALDKLVQWLKRTRHDSRVINAYGPTEATITSAFYDVSVDADAIAQLARLPIGKPIVDTSIYMLDGAQRPVPMAAPGEIYIGGIGLARGYLNRPDITAEKFVPHPFSAEPGARLYYTGDRARYLPDGNIDFLGRVDDQVKIRGVRIELGEVEAVLKQHGAVNDAVVIARQDLKVGPQLIAYVVAEAADPGLQPGELRRFMLTELPEHMLPSHFVMLDKLPLTANGKVDRRALPVPEQTPAELQSTYIAPRTPLEKSLAEIFAGILGLEKIGVDDNFFELGGHSLLATQVVSQVRTGLSVEIPVRTVFEAPTVAELARNIETIGRQAHGETTPLIIPVARNGNLPLSFAQERLWFLHQLDPANSAYNFPAALRLTGQLNIAALKRTLAAIVQRHESLRTTFAAPDGTPAQVIHPLFELKIPVVDVQLIAAEAREAEVRRLVSEASLEPFDLERGPLVRVLLLKLGAEEHVVALTMHHIVTDGWSLEIFSKETVALYAVYNGGQTSPLSPLRLQYADFAQWQRGWLQGDVLARQLDYWKQKLADAPVSLHLPADRPRPAMPSNRGANYSFTLPTPLCASLKGLSQQEDVTLFMVLLGAFQVLLHSYSGEDKIVVGTNIANRNRSDTEELIGFFVNNLALCTDLSGNPTFRQLLARVRETTLGAYDHQDLPFEKVLEVLRLEHHPGNSSFFQIFFVLQNLPLSAFKLPGLSLAMMEVQSGLTKFDLGLYMVEAGNELHGSMEYSTDLFDGSTIERLLLDFQRLLEAAVAQPEQDLETLAELLTPEQAEIVDDFNAELETY
jgi:surfactin family lipopeptide synthetase A